MYEFGGSPRFEDRVGFSVLGAIWTYTVLLRCRLYDVIKRGCDSASTHAVVVGVEVMVEENLPDEIRAP
jgi:hypothetical protein